MDMYDGSEIELSENGRINDTSTNDDKNEEEKIYGTLEKKHCSKLSPSKLNHYIW